MPRLLVFIVNTAVSMESAMNVHQDPVLAVMSREKLGPILKYVVRVSATSAQVMAVEKTYKSELGQIIVMDKHQTVQMSQSLVIGN